MTSSNPASTSSTQFTLEQAHTLLKRFDCLEPNHPVSSAERIQLKQALQVVVQASDYQMLGICAATYAEAIQALETYTQALGYVLASLPANESLVIDGAVYLKFNARAGSCYVDGYEGHHRGVLVSCQSADEGGVNEMYGHLPLDLFLEN